MGMKDILAELAEGMALGFVEEAADQLKTEAVNRTVNPQARSIGRQMAAEMLGNSHQPALIHHAIGDRPIQAELLPPIDVADEQQVIERRYAVWNHRQRPTPELLRALANYQERLNDE